MGNNGEGWWDGRYFGTQHMWACMCVYSCRWDQKRVTWPSPYHQLNYYREKHIKAYPNKTTCHMQVHHLNI